MAHIQADRVKDSGSTTGTGDFTVTGTAAATYETLDEVMVASDTFYYVIEHSTADEWEVGVGTYSGSHVFARTTVLQSSNSDALVSFSAGSKTVMLTLPARTGNFHVSPTDLTFTHGHITCDSAATNTVTQMLRLTSTSTGTPAAGIGAGIEFEVETAAGNNEIGGSLNIYASDVTGSSEDFYFDVKLMGGGATATSRARVTADGTTTGLEVGPVVGSAGYSYFSLDGTSGCDFTLSRWTNSASDPDIFFQKSRGTTVGAHGVVSSGDNLGTIHWYASDGDSMAEAASIRASVDGTPGDGDMPGRIVFATSADGSATPTDRATISSAGNVAIGTSTTTLARLHISSTTAYDGMLIEVVNDANIGAQLMLLQYSASPAAYDAIGTFNFLGRNNNSETIVYSTIQGILLDPTDSSEDGYMSFYSYVAGVQTHIMAVGYLGNVGIGTNTPGQKLSVIDGNIEIKRTSGDSALIFYDTTDGGYIVFSQDGTFRIATCNTSGSFVANVFSINSAGAATCLPVSPAPSSGVDSFGLTVSGSYGGGIGFVDGTGNVGMWTDTSGTVFHIGFGTSLGALTSELDLTTAALYPTTNDGLALGTTGNSFADVFLASGGLINWNNGTAIMSQNIVYGQITVIIGDNVNAITTTPSVRGYLPINFPCTITGWRLVADASGSIVVDVWKDTYANYPPVNADSIAGSEKPTLSSVQKNEDTSLSTWTTAISAGDVLGFEVESATTVKQVTLVLFITRT